jgi:hypothetical protein
MKSTTKLCLFTFAILLIMSAVAFAASDVWMGTWKLNEAKSKLGAGGPKNDTVTYEAAGDQIKVTIEGTQGDGSKTKTEWTGKFDGKEYASTGNPNEDMRSVKEVNARTLDVVSKKGSKVVLNAHVVLSADGKSRTVTSSGTGADGKKWKSVAVYDKQ